MPSSGSRGGGCAPEAQRLRRIATGIRTAACGIDQVVNQSTGPVVTD